MSDAASMLPKSTRGEQPGARLLSSALPDVASYTLALEQHGTRTDRIVVDEKGTICSATATVDTLSHASGLLVVTGGRAAGAADSGEILVKGTLSQGGMGKILLAEQVPLGREVAVKVVVPGKTGTRAESDLIVEAKVAGRLEHPNVVPVHLLGATADGHPVIVMKRIEGSTWKDLIHPPALQVPGAPEALTATRNLTRDVDILMDVCRALHFAHARGVVHRDVKPANVMVGLYGEVYLLDWGIAVGFGDDAPPELPHARDVRSVAGTAHYMAPEMALPEGTIDARTDVYLAGSVLHELITGAPPHARPTLDEALFAAHVAAEPVFRDDVPEELAEICKKALRRNPDERYQTAEELRLALVAFQGHAVARELCADAEGRLARLNAMPLDESRTDAREVQRTFTECRFGFTQALRAWPESARAKEGLERAIELMARREIGAGHYDSARLLVAELEEPPEELARQLEELRARREQEARSVEELQRVTHEKDSRVAGRERGLFMLGSASGWFVLLVSVDVLARLDIYHAASGSFAIFMLLFAAVMGAAGAAFPGLRATEASRMQLGIMFVGVLAIAMVHVVGWRWDFPPVPMLVLGHSSLSATCVALSAIDKRTWHATAIVTSIVPLIALFPNLVFLISAVGTFTALSIFAREWKRAASVSS